MSDRPPFDASLEAQIKTAKEVRNALLRRQADLFAELKRIETKIEDLTDRKWKSELERVRHRR